jgi:hypothetical protein
LKVYLKAIRLAGLVENFITTDSDGVKEARHTGILSPMSPIFDQEPRPSAHRAFQTRLCRQLRQYCADNCP